MGVPRAAFSHVPPARVREPRPARRPPGRWLEALRDSDARLLWSELRRVVGRHPLLRSPAAVQRSEPCGAYADLTQELFVRLLGKGRFQHYLDVGMSDEEIEAEVGGVELTNLLTEQLKKRHPESYRLARRVAVILQSSDKFRLFRGPYRQTRLSRRMFGLSVWPEDKPTRGLHELQLRAEGVPVRRRDRRKVGRAGDTELVIGNRDLEGLVVAVLEACDSPAELGTIRRLVLSRLHLNDFSVASFPRGRRQAGPEFADSGPDAEQVLLRSEGEGEAARRVEQFLSALGAAVRNKPVQYGRMLEILRRFYLSREHTTQLEVASALGVSDSLVSVYRRRIEAELRGLRFGGVEEARRFEEVLRARLAVGTAGRAVSGRCAAAP